MLAGRLASDSVPPRLTASLKICSAFKDLNAAAWPPITSNENVEPAHIESGAAAAHRLGLQSHVLQASSERDVDAVVFAQPLVRDSRLRHLVL
jgi:hypothetical protein